jgi:hypothetical protein
MKEIYGVSRSRDKKGNVISRPINPYVNCIHTFVGGGRMNTAVLVMEIEYEDIRYVSISERSE